MGFLQHEGFLLGYMRYVAQFSDLALPFFRKLASPSLCCVTETCCVTIRMDFLGFKKPQSRSGWLLLGTSFGIARECQLQFVDPQTMQLNFPGWHEPISVMGPTQIEPGPSPTRSLAYQNQRSIDWNRNNASQD